MPWVRDSVWRDGSEKPTDTRPIACPRIVKMRSMSEPVTRRGCAYSDTPGRYPGGVRVRKVPYGPGRELEPCYMLQTYFIAKVYNQICIHQMHAECALETLE